MFHGASDHAQGPPLNARTLRQFAGGVAALGLVVLGLSAWRHPVPTRLATGLGGLALAFGFLGMVTPRVIRLPYVLLLRLTQPIGHVVGLILLGIIYLGVITPVGWLLRRRGWDPLGLRGAEGCSYYVPHATPVDVRRYLRQYQPSGEKRSSEISSAQPVPRVRTVSSPLTSEENSA